MSEPLIFIVALAVVSLAGYLAWEFTRKPIRITTVQVVFSTEVVVFKGNEEKEQTAVYSMCRGGLLESVWAIDADGTKRNGWAEGFTTVAPRDQISVRFEDKHPVVFKVSGIGL